MTRVAAAQVSPVVFDREATLAKTVEWIQKAGREGVDLLVFPEAYFSAYPYWRGHETVKRSVELAVMMQKSGITVPGPETEVIGRACREANLNLIIGCNELDTTAGRRTMYNSVVAIGRSGEYIGRRRKLVPTHTERAYWGRGDAEDVLTFDMDLGSVGSLICYEHHMPLLRAAMAQLGEEIHCALWPGWWALEDHIGGKRGQPGAEYCEIDAAIREYAIENQCHVISCSAYLPMDAIPDEYKELFGYNLAVGGSAIVNPSGMYLEPPTFDGECLVVADIHADERALAKAYIDGVGHYARPDILELTIGPRSARGRSEVSPTAEMDRITKLEKEVDALRRAAHEAERGHDT